VLESESEQITHDAQSIDEIIIAAFNHVKPPESNSKNNRRKK
jgi:hypothetical protein